MHSLSHLMAAIATSALVLSTADAQIPEEPSTASKVKASFEVASVKLMPGQATGPTRLVMYPSGIFIASNVTVPQLILSAYSVHSYQIVGGPDWMGSQRFDIHAKAPDDFEWGQTRAMMRGLLEQRFGLVATRTTRKIPVYTLEWINSSHTPGIWLRRPSRVCEPSPLPPEKTIGPLGGRRTARATQDSKSNPECRGYSGTPYPKKEGWFYGRRVEITPLLSWLNTIVDRPVIDKTGLTGWWDFDLKWDPDPGRSDEVRSENDRNYGSMFTAVREQLGLTLKPINADVDVVVIEHLQQPTPN
jgi:uncharacterized protein (TIGR03435 family)